MQERHSLGASIPKAVQLLGCGMILFNHKIPALHPENVTVKGH